MRILQVVHGYPPAASGGTEVYVRDLARALGERRSDQVFILTRDADRHRPELSVRRFVEGGVVVYAINNLFQACASFEESYTHPALRAVARELLRDIAPDLVHVQHLTCLSTGLLEDIKAIGTPIVMTLNDYWMICHRGQLFDRRGERCDGPFENGCGDCIAAGMLAGPTAYRAGRLARTLPIPGAAHAVRLGMKASEALTPTARTRAATTSRLAHMRQAAGHVDLFLAPSETMAGQFRRFGIDDRRIVRCDQGIDLAPFEGLRRTSAPMLRVALAGGLIPSKAPHVLLDAVEGLPLGTLTLDVIGTPAAYHGDDAYSRAIDRRLGHPAIRRLGAIPHERMPAALSDVDILVIPSLWIENAPFIIREAFAAGAPVVASDLGGMAEMVRDGVDGRLFPAGDSAALGRILEELAREPGALERLRSGIRRPTSMQEDAAYCRDTYVSLGARDRARATIAATGLPAPRLRISAVVLNYRTSDQTAIAVRSIRSSLVQADEIVVVDNGSRDGSVERLRDALPGTTLIALPGNVGFSAGCSAGIRHALSHGADAVLLVNSDAVLAPGALGTLRDVLESDRSLGIVAPVLLSREEPDHVSSAGIAFSTTTARMRHRGAGLTVSLLPPGAVHDVDAASGCVMLIRRDVFDRAIDFDADYFFSFEDIDFCLRAKEAGFRTACVQEAFAYHEGGRSIGRRSARRVYYATRNHLKLSRRVGPAWASLARAPLVAGLNLAYVIAAPEVPLLGGLSAVGRGIWDHVRRRYGTGPVAP